jgi:hypothetical protein
MFRGLINNAKSAAGNLVLNMLPAHRSPCLSLLRSALPSLQSPQCWSNGLAR